MTNKSFHDQLKAIRGKILGPEVVQKATVDNRKFIKPKRSINSLSKNHEPDPETSIQDKILKSWSLGFMENAALDLVKLGRLGKK